MSHCVFRGSSTDAARAIIHSVNPPTRRTGLKLLIGSLAGARLLKPADASDHFTIGGGAIDVGFESGDFDLPRSALLDWVREAARAVTAYFGAYPVANAHIHIFQSERGQGVSNGRSFGDHGAVCRIAVGRHATLDQLHRDWVLTHEMVHFAFPSLEERHHWMEEGSATYVEPIARALVGNLTAEQVWHDMVRDIHQGLPEPGDRGLDNTHTWGRTYWGGALFCLLADIGIRKATKNARGLQDALRAVNRAGGNITADWPIERAFEMGDEATGATTLMDLYRQMRDTPVDVDLPALWTQLGVRLTGDTVVFDPAAPLAAMREAITRGS